MNRAFVIAMRVLKGFFLVGGLAVSLVVGYCAYHVTTDPWEVALKIPFRHHPNAFHFGSEGYFIAGEELVLNKDTPGASYYKSFILKSPDGEADWKTVYTSEGRLTDLSYNVREETIYALGRDNDKRATLISSTDKGKTWNLLEVPSDNIRAIDFSCSEVKYLWNADRLFALENGQAQYRAHEFQSAKALLERSAVDDNCNYWFIDDNIVYSIGRDFDQKEEVLEDVTRLHAITYSKETSRLLLAGEDHKKESLLLLERLPGGNYNLISRFPWFLASEIISDGEIIIVLGTNTNNVVSPLGLEKVLYFSHDSGITWDEDDHYPPFAKRPFFFINKELWVNASMQDIEKRKI